ncbi:RimJ/RimL family protein N-acetyltransferase [Stella humosa]|uniref:RimJ/RimL family protein N-acetyltransferase n=1 Tax=Stella humosa TaxID=94 RepID=A0A3N1MEA2_9PROT|nr:GNAT family N-acetyltransferase [Stella humosa]ROQ02053.1 RimJ/RimL family protein N-acetyltransferase [Stella humosa]BBK32443.1 alanine acetyltransferase [Stella humosa]
MAFPEEIRTDRLVLRRPGEADAEAIFAGYGRDPEVSRYLTWRPHRSIDDTRAYIAWLAQNWAAGTHRTYVIDAPARMCAGGIDLRIADEGRSVVFGYVLRRDLWGLGLMTEALSACVELALAQPGVWRAWAYCDIDNPASGRVMEKAGMTFEGILRCWSLHPNVDPVVPRDCRVYAKVRRPSPAPGYVGTTRLGPAAPQNVIGQA